MRFLILFFWYQIVVKKIFLWLYFWQLKEYRIDRFLEGFKTKKGKNLLFNFLNFSKIFLFLISFFSFSLFFFFLFFFYLLESLKTFKDLLQLKIKVPVFTKKIILLTFFSFSFYFFFPLFFFEKEKIFILILLILDILTPIFVSFLILFFQPFVALIKWIICQKAIRKIKDFKNLITIGVVGSYGKTSTKEFLHFILSKKFPALKTKLHQNNEMGISQTILNELKKEYKFFVCEMGAYKKGEIEFLCKIVKPKIGIITGINPQHLSLFGSFENLIFGEGGKELIKSLPQDGLVIFNGNNEICLKIFKETKIRKKIVFKGKGGKIENNLQADLWAENIKVEKEFVSFSIFSKDGDFAKFKINLLGEHNVENILLASCCAKEFGFKLKEISEICKDLKPLPHQMELKKTKNKINLIDSTYSTNINAIFSHLDYLKVWEKKKIIVMPCLIELGKESKKVHQKIGEKIGKICDLAIITSKDFFEQIKKGAKKREIFYFDSENPNLIFQKLKNFCQKDDVILLEGRLPTKLVSLLMDL